MAVIITKGVYFFFCYLLMNDKDGNLEKALLMCLFYPLWM